MLALSLFLVAVVLSALLYQVQAQARFWQDRYLAEADARREEVKALEAEHRAYVRRLENSYLQHRGVQPVPLEAEHAAVVKFPDPETVPGKTVYDELCAEDEILEMIEEAHPGLSLSAEEVRAERPALWDEYAARHRAMRTPLLKSATSR